MSKENRKKRLLRRCDKEGTVRNTFEKILQDKLSKMEQIEFIETKVEGNLKKLQSLRQDLDRYLLELNDWDGARTYFNRLAQRLNPDFDAIDEINEFSDLLDKHINSINSIQREKLTKDEIVQKALDLKNDGMKDEPLFNHFKEWLFDDLGFTNPELKKRFNFELHEHEEAHKTFSRFVNNYRTNTNRNN